MIRIVDYGLGNTGALANSYHRMNIDCAIARTVEDLRDASKIILPGVGSFDRAMELLEGSGMRQILDQLVNRQGIPVLGICVGMQILADRSDEGSRPGLSWIPGRVESFKERPACSKLPLPHMGWNDVSPVADHPLFSGLGPRSRFYFLHSYFLECAQTRQVAATSEYGQPFASAVHVGNVYGVQFHPEKSHRFGAGLLKNFASL